VRTKRYTRFKSIYSSYKVMV